MSTTMYANQQQEDVVEARKKRMDDLKNAMARFEAARKNEKEILIESEEEGSTEELVCEIPPENETEKQKQARWTTTREQLKKYREDRLAEVIREKAKKRKAKRTKTSHESKSKIKRIELKDIEEPDSIAKSQEDKDTTQIKANVKHG